MAKESNFDKKQQRRDAERRQARARRRAAFRKAVTLSLVALVALLVIGVVLYRHFTVEDPQLSTEPSTSTAAPTTTAPTQPTAPLNPTDRIELVFGGDLVINDMVVAAGGEAGQYDYTGIFQDLLPVLASADASGINFEGSTAGQPYGSATASAPPALLSALAHAGVDLIQLSNSYTVTNGILGLHDTMQNIRSAGMIPIGAYADQETAQREQGFTLCDIGGIRVALVAFTKGMNGLGLPTGNEHCVNLLYKDYASTYQKIDTDGIRKVLRDVQEQQPDITIALLHWGSEFNSIVSTRQETISGLMLEEGVDAIIGTHSHYVQKIVYDQENSNVIAYSLGDLYGDGEKTGTNYSILLELEITKDNVTGQTRITGCDYIPVYTLTPERDGEPMKVVRIMEQISMYENNHISKVGEKAYQNMKSALEKIRSKTGLYN